MTTSKSLKRLVRERMARTGETYTTAHRQVTARRAVPLPAGVTAGYPAFGAEAHQPSALVRHLLAQGGLRLSEPMVCGLGGGIGFLYAIFEYTEVDHPLLTIVAQHHPEPWFDAVRDHLKLGATTVTSSSTQPALGKLDAALDRGQAALISVDRGRLPWQESGPFEAADPHAIVVAGRDGDDYLIDDADDAPHRLPGEALADAWQAHRKGRFALTTLEPVGDVDISAGVRAAVTTTVAHLTGPVIGNAFDVNFGLTGMEKLLSELRNTTTKAGWVRRFGDATTFPIGMRRLAECLTWAYTAPGGTRPLYARFLEEAGPKSGLDLGAAAKEAALAGDGWTAIADAAGAVAEADVEPSRVFAELAELLEDTIERERVVVAALRGALG
jgi:Butirosin biosynthesis protein H, N-terminal/Domain of unknown function (DUF4872)